MYDEIYAEEVTTNRFDENVDLSTTYLGKIGMRREDIMKADESFPISEQGFVMGRYQMERNVIYCWIQEQVNLICQNIIIYCVKHYMIYPNLLQKHKEFR